MEQRGKKDGKAAGHGRSEGDTEEWKVGVVGGTVDVQEAELDAAEGTGAVDEADLEAADGANGKIHGTQLEAADFALVGEIGAVEFHAPVKKTKLEALKGLGSVENAQLGTSDDFSMGSEADLETADVLRKACNRTLNALEFFGDIAQKGDGNSVAGFRNGKQYVAANAGERLIDEGANAKVKASDGFVPRADEIEAEARDRSFAGDELPSAPPSVKADLEGRDGGGSGEGEERQN